MYSETSFDELFSELSKISKSGSDGLLTAAQISEQTGIHIEKVRKLIRSAQQEGRLRVGKIVMMSISGKTTHVPGYAIIASPKKTTRK